MVAPIELVDVASIVTTELAIGEVVPNEDGVVVPLTAPDSWENADASMRCRGESVWNEKLSEDTST